MGHVTRPRPLQGQFVIRRLRLAMINLYTKGEVSVVTVLCTKLLKCRNWDPYSLEWHRSFDHRQHRLHTA